MCRKHMAAEERTGFEIRFRFNSWFPHQPLHSAQRGLGSRRRTRGRGAGHTALHRGPQPQGLL